MKKNNPQPPRIPNYRPCIISYITDGRGVIV